jgi:hypothetical protein
MTKIYSTLAATLLIAATIQSALASDDLSQRIAACTREHDDARRLACFDRAAAPAVDAKKLNTTQDFGVQGSELARNRDEDDANRDSTPKRISATVTGIEKRARGELVVTLDNGQVWAQTEVGPYYPIKVGDAVSIVAGTLGSHKLVVASRATAVTRVR